MLKGRKEGRTRSYTNRRENWAYSFYILLLNVFYCPHRTVLSYRNTISLWEMRTGFVESLGKPKGRIKPLLCGEACALRGRIWLHIFLFYRPSCSCFAIRYTVKLNFPSI